MERWNPFRDMESMQSAMDRFWQENFSGRGLGGTRENNFAPAVDLTETDNGYELHASIPGFKAEDIQIDVNRDTVVIRGQHHDDTNEQKRDNYIYRERRSGSFYRQVRLPEAVDTEQVQAQLDHGVLRLTLPRLPQAVSRRVQVMGGTNPNRSTLEAATPANNTAPGQIASGSVRMTQPTDNPQLNRELNSDSGEATSRPANEM